MNRLTGKFVRFLMFIAILAGCFYSLNAQKTKPLAGSDERIEVPILDKIGSSNFICFIPTAAFDEAEFKRLSTVKDCSFPNLERFKPDFQTQTVIGFHLTNRCRVQASAAVFRHDRLKQYEIEVKSTLSDCEERERGFQGWLAIKKIPADYKIVYREIETDDKTPKPSPDNPTTDLSLTPKQTAPIEKVEARHFAMKDCIQTYRQTRFIIKDDETFKKSIRHDMSREGCLKGLEKIDFDKNTLLGIEVSTGYCGDAPVASQARKDSTKKVYILRISYIPPDTPCRALSRSDVWVLVPKLPADYQVKFEIESINYIR